MANKRSTYRPAPAIGPADSHRAQVTATIDHMIKWTVQALPGMWPIKYLRTENR